MFGWMRWLVVVALLSSCIRSELVHCDDGIACPAGYTCTPNGCRSPEQLDACAELSDGDACRVSGAAGICDQSACVVPNCGNGIVELSEQCDCGDPERPGDPSCNGTYNGGASCSTTCDLPRCGDGVVDPGEVCDDGNAVPGDGCSFDCRSDEHCGNGTVDYFAGEACDDGNTRNRDGCAATCRDEAVTWESSLAMAQLGSRNAMAAAYDAARERIVAFGGTSGGALKNETWEHDGTHWVKRELAMKPSPRTGHAMVYDGARHRIVMFGGVTQLGYVAETWEYDGFVWIQRAPLVSPPARSDHAMAYDAARGRIVLFGGYVAGVGASNDTWEYDGTTWVQVTPAATAPKRFGHVMAYDPVRGRTVLFGGNSGLYDYNGTYEYDGTTWSLRNTDDDPSARSYTSMTFDTRRGHVVLFGGIASDPELGDADTTLGDAFEWDGTLWLPIDTTTSPAARGRHTLVHDSARGWDVVFGGYYMYIDDEGEQFITDWQDLQALSSEWIDLTAAPAVPGSGSASAVAFDSRRGRLVLLKGSETWEHDGHRWIKRTGTTPPSGTALALASDAERGVTVMYGTNAITWEYDGTTWQARTPAAAPPARSLTAMTYDAVRKRIVLFGGRTSSLVVLGDTWEYDGTNWTERTLPASPAPRYGHGLAYDQARQRVVLFGGATAAQKSIETWEYDGATWTQVVTAASPPVRTSPALTYDAARRRIVLFGGFGPTSPLADTWEYDGTTWVAPLFDIAPSAGFALGMAFDTVDEQSLLYAGTGTGEVWRLHTIQQAVGEACAAGVDYDGDGATGCDDDECWGTCSPLCLPDAPTSSCVAEPSCGDTVCEGAENCRNCPGDCALGGTACPSLCGDFECDPTENATSCPGDCF
jgi:cysteine-rich repeat protein